MKIQKQFRKCDQTNSVCRRGRRAVRMAVMIVTVLSLTACGLRDSDAGGTSEPEGEVSSEAPERVDTGFILTGPESFDSADTPILVRKNADDNTVTFLNLDLGKYYTLSVDGTTRFYDKYGQSISLEQLKIGDIVDITFLKSDKHLTSMQLSTQAWVRDDVTQYQINMARGEVTIGKDVYGLTSNTQYLSNGRNIEQMELNAADVLSFQGIEDHVLSITVEKGHGYLRLVNDENFVGGWIEIGQSVIQRITEDMLLAVPEGSHQVRISHNGGGGVKNVVINRNEEMTLDIGDLEVAEPQTGTVLFSLSPEDLELYIDGTLTDASQPVVLDYGIHQLIAKAGGYKSVTRYLSVGEESAAVNIILDSMDSAGDDSSESSGSSTSTTVDTITNYYKVYIDAPAGAEVYLDGSYVGIAPCSFRKTEGSHVIILRKSGYLTRSYTIQVDNEERDTSFSFADLEVYESSTTDTSDVLSSLVSEALGALTGSGNTSNH